MIKFTNVYKNYRTGILSKKYNSVLQDVSFTIQKNSIVSLIGESGSGKTTIGKILLKLIESSTGSVTVDGNDIASVNKSNAREYYRMVQGIFQDPFSAFNPVYKADNIFFMVRSSFFHDVPLEQWNQKVRHALQQVGLEPDSVLNKFPHQLSGGQLQRFLIARVLLLNASYVVADEIISMLDASTRIDILNILMELKEKGLSVLFITHDLNLGYYLSDEVIILYKGVIVERGETKEVFNTPLHPYTQSLLASVPRMDKKWDKLQKAADNSIANIGNNACVFAHRCSKVRQNCNGQCLMSVNEHHEVACNLWKEHN